MAINVQLRKSDGTGYVENVYVGTLPETVEGLLSGQKIDKKWLSSASTGESGLVKLTNDLGNSKTLAFTQYGANDLYNDLRGLIRNLESPIDYVASMVVNWDTDTTTTSIKTEIEQELTNQGYTEELRSGLAVLINNVGDYKATTSAGVEIDTNGYWLWIKEAGTDGEDGNWFPSIDFPEVPEASTITKGITKLATTEEGKVGYASDVAMTPRATRAAIEKFGNIPIGSESYLNTLDSAKVPGSLAFVVIGPDGGGTINKNNINYTVHDGGDIWLDKPGVSITVSELGNIVSFDNFAKTIVFETITIEVEATESAVDGLWLPPEDRMEIPIYVDIGLSKLYKDVGITLRSSPDGWIAQPAIWNNVAITFDAAEWSTFWSNT